MVPEPAVLPTNPVTQPLGFETDTVEAAHTVGRADKFTPSFARAMYRSAALLARALAICIRDQRVNASHY